jgi:hypothetical protein
MASKGVNETVAVRRVLGISYDELGMGVARTWRFPDRIVQSMRALPAGKPGRPKGDVEMLRNLSSFSNALINAAGTADGKEGRGLEEVLARFENAFPMSEKQLRALLTKTRERVKQFSDVLGVNLEQSLLMERMKERGEAPSPAADGAAPGPGGVAVRATSHMDTSELEVPAAFSGQRAPEDRQGVLINGIQDITNTLLGDYDLNDVLTMIMETMYRGLALQSVFLCFREGNRSVMGARLGFGKDIEEVSRRFRFPIESQARDVFGLAVTHGKDIHISNAGDPRIRKRIPDWYHQFIGDPAFALFPVIVEKRPFALFFLGRDQTVEIFDEKSLNYLRTLRNQAVLAVRQKR